MVATAFCPNINRKMSLNSAWCLSLSSEVMPNHDLVQPEWILKNLGRLCFLVSALPPQPAIHVVWFLSFYFNFCNNPQFVMKVEIQKQIHTWRRTDAGDLPRISPAVPNNVVMFHLNTASVFHIPKNALTSYVHFSGYLHVFCVFMYYDHMKDLLFFPQRDQELYFFHGLSPGSVFFFSLPKRAYIYILKSTAMLILVFVFMVMLLLNLYISFPPKSSGWLTWNLLATGLWG